MRGKRQALLMTARHGAGPRRARLRVGGLRGGGLRGGGVRLRAGACAIARGRFGLGLSLARHVVTVRFTTGP